MFNLTPNSEPGQETSAYVRQAKPDEIETIADVLTRAFARDPMMNWLGDVRALVPTDNKGDEDEDADVRRTLANLRDFELGNLKMERPDGLLQVVVVKEGKAGGEGEGEERKGEGEGEGEGDKERIVGCALWARPVKRKEPYLSSLFSLAWLVKSWGFCGIKRFMFDFVPKAGEAEDRTFDARGLNRLDAWHLLQIAVDPPYQGKGYSTLLLREGFQYASGKPIFLESTSPRSRDIYAQSGFEMNEALQFGVGSVDESGIAAKGDAAVGWPCFIMTKWENP